MAPRHGARPDNDTCRALSFLVQDAGTSSVNGVYLRTGDQNQGADVFMKKGTNYALFRRKENHWSLADLGGGTPDRWNLRCTELYRCDRVPGGFVPPDFGWKASEGMHPCPVIFSAKNPDLRLTLPRMELSESQPELRIMTTTKPRPLSASDGTKVFGDSRKDEIMKKNTATAGSTVPLFASSHAALTSGLAKHGTAGHVNFILAYRVMMARPNNKVAWGCKWSEDSYADIGARDIEEVDAGSPLMRWNIWQKIRSRPDVCIREGDRLVRVDGRWAYFELEIGNDQHEQDDPTQSLQRIVSSPTIPVQSAFDGSKAGKSTNNTVYDFARREVLRPMPPGPPKVSVPETEALVEVSWSPLAWHPAHIAWAVIVQDIAVNIWYTIDAAGTARQAVPGQDVGSIRGDINFVTVLKGLTQGRTYAACVAVLTEYGWSAFSALSRAMNLPAQITISEVLLEDVEHPPHAIDPDAWPDRPRFVVPVRVVPGATAPISCLPGPNTFMAARRRLHMKILCPTMEGLELSPVDFICEISRDTTEEPIGLAVEKISRLGVCLVVTGISPGGLVDEWNRVNPKEVHIKRNDRIMAVNSVRTDMDRMAATLQEAVGPIRLTIVRGPKKIKKAAAFCGECGTQFEDEIECYNCGAKPPKDNNRPEFAAAEERQVLQVVNIRPGSPAARWVEEVEERDLCANFHGTQVGAGLHVGDKIIAVNGLTSAAKMVAEISREPGAFTMKVERVLGHDLEGTDAAITILHDDMKATRERLRDAGWGKRIDEQPELIEKRQQLRALKQQHMREVAQEWARNVNPEEIFEVDHMLDPEAVKFAEEIQFNCLLPHDEGELMLALVGSEMEQLEIRLEEVLRLTEEATLSAGNRQPRYTYPSLVNDSQSRVLLFDRRQKTDHDRIEMLVSSKDSGRRSFTGETPDVEDAALTALKAALVDVKCEPGEIVGALKMFERASPAVKTSPAAKKMLGRAETLKDLWHWRVRFTEAKRRLCDVIDQALEYETQRLDNDSDSEHESKPYDIAHLDHAIDQAREFSGEITWEFTEAVEIRARQSAENNRQRAKQNLHVVLRDPREDKASLQSALDKCKEAGVHHSIVEAGETRLEYWEKKHKRDKAREAIRKALKTLEEKIIKRERPGAGSDEQKIVREALLEAHLEPDDPLNVEAQDLLAQWKSSNAVLRAEAKLHSAVERATGGWKHSEPRAGDLLGSAIAQVATEGVDYKSLEEARATLTHWEFSRQRKAASELEIAMQYGDTEHLKESIAFARQAGYTEEMLAVHEARLERLRYQEEIDKKLGEAFDGPIDTPLLEKIVAFAHEKKFVEEESSLLCSATMQLNCRFWTEQFRSAIQSKCAVGLSEDVPQAEELVRRCEFLLETNENKGGLADVEPEIARTVLERDLRPLKLMMPSVAGMAAVFLAEAELNRVLGAVEKYAEDLPEVIENGHAQICNGLKESLLSAANHHKKAYDDTIRLLEKALTVPEGESSTDFQFDAEKIKNCLIKAHLAGAPQTIIKKAWEVLEERFPEVNSYCQAELELLVALAEADDIDEMAVEARFLRLQNAADEARKLNPPLISDTWTRVEKTNLALAAERTLVMKMADSEVILAGLRPGTAASKADSRGGSASSPDRPMSKTNSRTGTAGSPEKGDGSPSRKRASAVRIAPNPQPSANEIDELPSPSATAPKATNKSAVSADEVMKIAEALSNACVAAQQSALEEAQKLIPEAQNLVNRLKTEANMRREALLAVEEQKEQRQGSSKDLRTALINAREVSVPLESLQEAYQQLRDMKVAFLTEDLSAAQAAGRNTVAIAFWFRAQALRFEGVLQRANTIADFFGKGQVADVVTLKTMMSGDRCGGSFGTATWRQNPQFAIRFSTAEQAARQKKGHGHGHKEGRSGNFAVQSIPNIHVTVAVAEASEMPATLSVHVVRNSAEATAAGCRWFLAPGYEVLAQSDICDDLPTANFELLPSDDNRPVFIVPSSAKGEEGPFNLIVEGSGPVDVVEVSDECRDIFHYRHDETLEWSAEMPFRKNCGGGRFKKAAPPLSWYRNPQFCVRLKSRAQVAKDKSDAEASALSTMVSGFPFAEGKGGIQFQIEESEPEQTERSEGGTSLQTTARDSSEAGMTLLAPVRIEVLHVSNFSEPEGIVGADVLLKCGVDGGSRSRQEIFCTQAVSGSDPATFDFTHICQDFMSDESLYFTFEKVLEDGKQQTIARVTLPYAQFREGFDGSIGMVEDAGQEFCAQLTLKIAPTQEATPIGESPAIAATTEPSKPAKEVKKRKIPPAILQVRMLPVDSNQHVPCAVHIVQNGKHEDERIYPNHKICENPFYHHVIASSAVDKEEYQIASEVGCVSKLIHGAEEEDEGEPVFIIPSLETNTHTGKFSLQFLATEDIIIDRVN